MIFIFADFVIEVVVNMKALICEVWCSDKCVVDRHAVFVDESTTITFINILDIVKSESQKDINGTLKEVVIAQQSNKLDKCTVNPNTLFSHTLALFNVKYVDFIFHSDHQVETAGPSKNSRPSLNALQLLTSPVPRKLRLKTGARNLRIDLYNDMVEYFQRDTGLVKRGYSIASAEKKFGHLVDVLWALDGQHAKINDAAYHKGFQKIPDE